MKLSIRTIAIVLILVIVGIVVVPKVGKRIVKAYNDFESSQVKDRGIAPELESPIWYNAKPESLSSLRGQVVIVDFWRLECPQCVSSLHALLRTGLQPL